MNKQRPAGNDRPVSARPAHALLLTSIAALLTAACPPCSAAESIDLAGTWRFALDPQDLGIKASPTDWDFPDTIQLPGCLQAQGFGDKPSMDSKWTGEGWRYPEMFKEGQAADDFKFPFNLQPPRLYTGPAWYQRDIEIPADWAGKHVSLHLERPHWQTTAWLDGKPLGTCDSLGTPHVFVLSRSAGVPPVSSSSKHTLTIRIDNRLSPVNPGPLSHSVTDATQGNWNGVVGRIELRAALDLRFSNVSINPRIDGSVGITIDIANDRIDPVNGRIEATVHELPGGRELGRAGTDIDYPRGTMADGSHVFVTTDRKTLDIKLDQAPRLWSEFSPALYQVRLKLVSGKDTPADSLTRSFGFRNLGTRDGRITINDRRTFLRGTLECCIFPLTGHPPTDPESWLRIIRIAKAHGLNHMRFHSWCPPEAAFAAADQLGFYLQLEVSSWANQGAEIGSGRPLDKWIDDETARMLQNYGHHPSFIMLAYGNEPAGPNHKQWLQQWVARWKEKDPQRLYTTGSGWPVTPGSDWHSSPNPRLQGWGEGLKSIINSQPPRSDFDWADRIAKFPPGATISHEIGQWCVYPDFSEIKKYTGYFKARNFELFRDLAERNGILPQAADFLHASGRLQVLAYKHDIEAALRTPGFGGFQLLDLHDFPGQGTALVGVLDPFWDSKPYCTPEEYSSFCGPTVPLIRAKSFVLTSDQSFEADAQLAHFGPADLDNQAITWSLTATEVATTGAQRRWTQSTSTRRISEGSFPARNYPTGDLHDLGRISIPLAGVPAPAHLVLQLGAATFHNQWDLFVYPAATPSSTSTFDVERSTLDVHSSLPDALAALQQGKSVLWLPPAATIRNDPERPLKAGFSPIFWNTAWTNWQPPHTLGILCDPKHPALEKFPTQSHSNWQWWEIVSGAQPFILTKQRDLRPIVQPIDDWFTNRKLGLVFEAKLGQGRLLACAADLATNLDRRPAARQLRQSLLDYMASDAFHPATTLSPADLESLVRRPPVIMTLGASATATSSEPGYEPAAAIDSDPATLWHTAFSEQKPAPPHDLVLTFKQPVALAAILLTQRQDKNPNGQLKDLTILAGGRELARASVPLHAAAHRINLPPGTRATTLTLRVTSSHAGPFASLAELDVVAAE